MLSGTFPFSDSSVAGLYKKILKNDYSCPGFFKMEEVDLINKILDSNPSTRIGLEEIKNHKWMVQNKPANFDEDLKQREKIFLNKIVLESL